jgi:Sulfotransferase family
VTGVPRSGTTWLARQLAGAPGCAMTGREPMNPNEGQYRLAGTVDSWVRLRSPGPRQRRALRLAYAGLSPRVYGRYGYRQWAAALPVTRTVVKDPFAVLSVRAVVRETSAVPVLVYRHPAAVLASYRRMHWWPDVAEVSGAVPPEETAGDVAPLEDPTDDTSAMAWFWSTLNTVALHDLAEVDDAVVVSHEELAAGGEEALRTLFDACGVTWTGGGQARHGDGHGTPAVPRDDDTGQVLHRLDRAPDQVATAWRAGIDDAELSVLEDLAGPTYRALQAARLPLG